MADQTLYPTGEDIKSNLTGSYLDVDDDPSSPDGNWLTCNDRGVDVTFSGTFDTPTSEPAGTQTFRVWVRKFDNTGGGVPSITISIYENGTSRGTTSVSGVSLADSTSGELFSGTWDASLLQTSDGSAVECHVLIVSAGGGPNERCGEIGAIAWDETAAQSAEATPSTVDGATSIPTPSITAGTGTTVNLSSGCVNGSSTVPTPTINLGINVNVTAVSGVINTYSLTIYHNLGYVGTSDSLAGNWSGLVNAEGDSSDDYASGTAGA